MSQQLSDEELRQYVAQLREAPVAELVAQAFNLVGGWAEAKLGRPDARPLIDALAGIVKGAGAALPVDLARQMSDGIGQLQLAQVQTEEQLAARGPQKVQPDGSAGVQPDGSAGAQPEGGAKAPPDAPPATAPPGAGTQQPLTDRLWIPGRDPKPPRN